ADIKLSQSITLEIDESMLTGESLTTEKNSAFVSNNEMPAGDRLDMAYAGTVVLSGRGQGEVIATGIQTEIGKIASDVTGNEDSQPPLMLRIHKFTMQITWAMLILILMIFAITIARGNDLSTVFLLSVALAVSAIPEGLPVAITIAL
ncbi:PREDICTED: calcium-transporting ATPase-like, partial [Priapulus caudatus]|uniref:Calcium-transporting ATPase-like n=1 Tax=Priapulus caudatus TaxID=37621 RepID=A0ABM1F7Z7_PRICU